MKELVATSIGVFVGLAALALVIFWLLWLFVWPVIGMLWSFGWL